uniref:Progestin and adipoQ receptor family member 7 n=1 Tax=Anas platyrhynchos TaxID=8839 RepID=A0A8B9TCM6_ANAPL
MDYVGVAVYQYGSALGHYYYAIEPSWHEKVKGFYMPGAVLLAWLSCAGSCYAKFRYHQSAHVLGRLCQEIAAVSQVPGLFFLIGAFFFSHPYPEKLFPGKCHFFGQSHQIFHVCLVLCTLAQIEAVVLDYESRRHIYSSLHGDLAHNFSALTTPGAACAHCPLSSCPPGPAPHREARPSPLVLAAGFWGLLPAPSPRAFRKVASNVRPSSNPWGPPLTGCQPG